jgi:hypothetical protein
MWYTLDNNLTVADHVLMAVIDQEYFSAEYLTAPEITWAYYCRNKDTYICIRDTESGGITAYLSMLSIGDEVYKAIVSGERLESQVRTDEVLQYNAPGEYKLLLSAIAIEFNYRKINFVVPLLRALKRKIAELEQRGIIFTDVIVDCVLEEGALLRERLLNMKCISVTSRNTKIYWAAGLFNNEKGTVRKDMSRAKKH